MNILQLPLKDVPHFVPYNYYFGIGIGSQVCFDYTTDGRVHCTTQATIRGDGNNQLALVTFFIWKRGKFLEKFILDINTLEI